MQQKQTNRKTHEAQQQDLMVHSQEKKIQEKNKVFFESSGRFGCSEWAQVGKKDEGAKPHFLKKALRVMLYNR